MDDLGLHLLLGGLVIAVLIWGIRDFLRWKKLFREGVIVDGRIWAHRREVYKDGEGESVQLYLMYTYDCQGTNYLHEEKVNSAFYHSLKDGDSVKVRCLPQDPMFAQLEKPLLSRR